MTGDALPVVTIGVPVYNGGTGIARALASLLEQDHPSCEIVISDNASTDRTSETCRQFAQQHANVAYHRQSENIGPFRNFLAVLERARGQYFMWACHDDMWSPEFVSVLAQALDDNPEAVLATPCIRQLDPDGSPSVRPSDRSAPGSSRFDNIRVFTRDGALSWIYGLYRTEWLREQAPKIIDYNYPGWTSDFTWMFETLLANSVVGSDRAVLYKTVSTRRYGSQSQRDRLIGWICMFREMNRICLRHTHGRDRLTALWLAWYYCYRKYLRRGNPIGTPVRILKVLAMATYFRLRYGPLTPPPLSSAESH